MSNFLFRWLALSVAVFIAAHLSFLGISYDHISAVLVVSLVLGLLNTFLKPLLIVVALPAIILSLGLFMLVINALLFYLAGHMVEGFHVHSFWSALGGAVVVGVVNFMFRPRGGGPPAGGGWVYVGRPQLRRNPSPPRQGPPPGEGPVIDV